MASNAIDFNYTVKDGNLSVSITGKDGKTTTKTGKEAASIFIENGYSQSDADQIIANLLSSASYDKNADSILSDSEIQDALNAAGEAGTSSVDGTGGSQAGAGGVNPDATVDNPVNGTQNAEETKKSEYKSKSNADLATSQGEAQKNYDAAQTDMNTAQTNVNEAKESFQSTTETQDKLVQEAEEKLNYTHDNYDEIKEQFGEDIANALDDVKTKQEAQDEAQNNVNTLTTGVADATSAVSAATSAVAEANAALTSAQAALDAAPMFIPTGETDENGNPKLEPNPELESLQAAVQEAEAKVTEAEQALEERKTELAEKEQELQQAEQALEEATTARNESQKVYEEIVANSEFAEDEALKAITAAVQGVSEAQDTRKTAIDEAKKVVTEASTALKETSDAFNNNQKALNEINREVNTRMAKGIWDPSSDKTPEEIEAEQKEEAEKAEETEETEDAEKTYEADENEETEGEEAADGQEKEELPTKGNAEDLSQAAKAGLVTYAMVKDELKLAAENNVNLKDYVYAVGQDNVYHLYNAQTGKSIAREYGAQSESSVLGLNVWGGGFDIVGNGSGYLKESAAGDYKTVYSYSDSADTIIATEKQYNTSSPLSFDLDGNGINTTNEMISYDIDGDGIKDNIFNSADAVLVFDKDGDGISGKDGSECFGDNTDLDGDGKADGYKDGFEALKALAKDKGLIGGDDNTLSAEDIRTLEQECGLKIKLNGYNSEAVSLSEVGISDINLAKTNKTSTDYNFDGKGSELMHQQGATFKFNGVEREYADLWHRKFDEKHNFFK